MKRTAIKKISDKQRAKNTRELPIRIEIIKRANGYCERCGTRSRLPMYPLSVHHKKIGANREEIKSVDDGEALCIICHAKAHKQNARFSEPQFGRRK